MAKKQQQQKPVQQSASYHDKFFDNDAIIQPYVKAALQGFAGSGKSRTGFDLSIGIYKRIKSTKPIILFDTEASAQFFLPRLDKEGIPWKLKRSRSLQDLGKVLDMMENEGLGDVIFLDSITHIWEGFVQSYMERISEERGRIKKFMEMLDWQYIKPIWKKQFSDRVIMEHYHFIFTGRAGYEYDTSINETTNKREFFKTKVKMAAEKETAHEPNLLIYMEFQEKLLAPEKKEVYREATVLKDRSEMIDGQTFRNPTYKDFSPHIEFILARPAGPVRDQKMSHNSQEMFDTSDSKLGELSRRKKIAIEKIDDILLLAYQTRTTDDTISKKKALTQVFGTSSQTEIESLSAEELEGCLPKLQEYVGKYPAVVRTPARSEGERGENREKNTGEKRSDIVRVEVIGDPRRKMRGGKELVLYEMVATDGTVYLIADAAILNQLRFAHDENTPIVMLYVDATVDGVAVRHAKGVELQAQAALEHKDMAEEKKRLLNLAVEFEKIDAPGIPGKDNAAIIRKYVESTEYTVDLGVYYSAKLKTYETMKKKFEQREEQ